MSEIIYTNEAPNAIGPYSQGVKCGNLVFTSGQIAIDPESGSVVEKDIVAQTERVCKNISAILNAAGSSLDMVVKTTCFLSDMSHFAAFNEVYAKYFTSKPARCIA